MRAQEDGVSGRGTREQTEDRTSGEGCGEKSKISVGWCWS